MHKLKHYLKTNFKKPLRHILPYVYPYWKTYCSLILLLFLNLTFTISMAWLLQSITDAAMSRDFHELKSLILLGVCMVFITSVLAYINTYMESVAIQKVTRDLKIYLFDKTLRLQSEQFQNYHSGELVSRLTNDINSTADLVGSNLLDLIRLPITFIIICCFLISLNWKLTLVSVSLAPILLLSGVSFGLLLKQNGKRMLENLSHVNRFLNDTFAGHAIIRTFSLERLLIGKYKELCDKQFTLDVKYTKLSGGMNAGTSAASGFAYFLNLSYGAYLVAHGSISVGSLLAFISLMQHLVYPLMGMASSWSGFQHSVAAFERIWEILGNKSDIIELSTPGCSSIKAACLELHNVSFSYDGKTSVLKDLSVTIPSGSVTAIVGPSGAGKSTLFKLLLGLQKKHSGSIILNGLTIQQIPYPEYNSYFSYVPQEPYLFDGTIRENLLHGNPDATELELIQAAKDAQIHDFIMTLPEKYDYHIGERGFLLSGGQKQRLSIARAILKNAPILLLDEATSALDTENEFIVQRSLEKLMKGRTTIVIAHRLSTVQNADWIVVLDQGTITAQGSHQMLINKYNAYANMFRLQLRSDEISVQLPS